MIFVKYLSLIELIQCSVFEKVVLTNTFPVITNYRLNNDADFDALAFLAFNDYMISILYGIVLNDARNINMTKELLTLDFLNQLFMQKSKDGNKTVYDVLKKYNYKSFKKNEIDYDPYDTFTINTDNNKQNLFVSLCTWYYEFMGENKKEIMENKTLLYFYMFCTHYTSLCEWYCDSSDYINLIEFI
ncbi:hypothetical protein COBT_002391 [Conglomerata obtusa]